MRTMESQGFVWFSLSYFAFFFKKKKSFQLRGINSILQTLKIKTVFQIFVQKQSLIILYEWHISFK